MRGLHGRLRRGRGTGKQPVFGVFEREVRVYTEIIPDCGKATLQAVISGKVAVDSVICGDGWRGYNGLVDVGYSKHFRVHHGANEFARDGHCHINGIESFRSFTRRRPAKFNGVKANFELHLKEYERRWKKDADMLARELWKILRESSACQPGAQGKEALLLQNQYLTIGCIQISRKLMRLSSFHSQPMPASSAA